MKAKVHLVRHGEVHNPEQLFYGRIPGYVLSEQGKQEVHALGNHLKTIPTVKIYASPLDRTKQTAAILAEYFPGIDIVYDERIIEVGSPLEGKPFREVEGFNFYDEQYTSQGGETLEAVKGRMLSFFQDVVPFHENEDIIVVSHGDPIMITRSVYMKNDVSIEDLRGGYYIHTAHGVGLTFEDEAVSVMDIIPQ